MTLLIKLIIAHLLGDFWFQPDKWVAAKERGKIKSPALYWHILIHFILVMLLVWDFDFLPNAIIITLLHYVTDLTKLYNPYKGRRWFFIDQLIHLAVILAVWKIYTGTHVSLPFLHDTRALIIIAAFVFITKPASVIIKTLMSQWQVAANTSDAPGSLPKAGEIIGHIERILILVMILLNKWEGIGFLLAAKSIFRFGDLKGNDRKLTEYILIGTLLSFSITIIIGVAIQNIASTAGALP